MFPTHGCLFARVLARREAQSEPRLLVLIDQEPGKRPLDLNELVRQTARAVNILQRSHEFIVGQCLLILLEVGPIRRFTERTEMLRAGHSADADENEKDLPEKATRDDHKLDFRTFNIMFARC